LKPLFIAVVLISIISYLSAQQDYTAQVESLYNQGQYQKVLDNIENIFRTEKNLSVTTLVQLYTYQAFSYVALDKKESAINAFRYLLIINPDITLDPRFVSPKIIELFEESKRLVGDTLQLKPSIFISTEKTGSSGKLLRNQAIKSLLYPGLGQLSQNKKTKGYSFLGGETISLIGLITSHFLTNSAHQKYLDNRDISKMDELYNNYASLYSARTGFIISSVGIWILSYIDATLFN
jgi:tetratricopeptide (TPR) repeat protein